VLPRLIVLFAGACLALVLSAPAVAVSVHVRVEGANATIYGGTEPLLTPVAGTIVPPGGDSVTVSADTVLGALERASRRGEFYYVITTTSFGPYVSRIGRNEAGGSSGWVFKVNGVSPPVGAHDHTLKEGDRVLWYFATFGPSGGPKTLHLRKLGRGCFEALARDDNGASEPARNVIFRVNGARAVRSTSGRLCAKPAWRLVRVEKAGLVPSRTIVRG
jgi:hypothetical protein